MLKVCGNSEGAKYNIWVEGDQGGDSHLYAAMGTRYGKASSQPVCTGPESVEISELCHRQTSPMDWDQHGNSR